jgi:hypothetical protein
LLVLLIVLFIVFCGLIALSIVLYDDRDHDHHEQHERGSLVLMDSQRLLLSSSAPVPVAGTKDIVLIVVQNTDGLDIVNITVNVVLYSISPQRSFGPLAVTCPPLYATNVVGSLAPEETTTCQALYTLTSGDVVNGNTLYTSSSATGTSIDGTDMEVVAVPGSSQLSINNVQIAPGAVIGGPTGPAGPVAVVTGYCTATAPHTVLTCGSINQLQMLFCDPSSDASQVGNIYMCVGTTWTFYGSVDWHGNGTAGPPGIGIYSATCAGGPPPTTVSSPSYVCNQAFNLNMVLCGISSTQQNAGIIYACMCSPTCGWVEVANLAALLTWVNGYGSPMSINTTNQGWTDIASVVLPATGTYQCLFESIASWVEPAPSCPLFYGITSASQSDSWVDNSEREVTISASFNPIFGNYVTIVTTAQVVVASAPQTWYVTAGLFGMTGCGAYSTVREATLRCLKTS